MSSFKVRPARREDAEVVLAMMRELNDFQELPPPLITLDGLRRDVFDNERPYVSVNIAVSPSPDDGGEVVVGQVIFFVIFDAVLLQKLVYIEDIYVRPEYRCRGIGLALWKSAAEQGVLRNCDGLRLEVLGTNKEAVDFYAKRGARDLGSAYGFQHFKLVWDAASDGIKA
uniref:Diamine N-acetyltransferase n=1 Tax=Rhipicephalus zambeziensis TaxID=60191 RepID=A0A224YL18_9ACAR